jgi:hypothetical protein
LNGFPYPPIEHMSPTVITLIQTITDCMKCLQAHDIPVFIKSDDDHSNDIQSLMDEYISIMDLGRQLQSLTPSTTIIYSISGIVKASFVTNHHW